jgi:hypothetical protein
VDKTAHSFPDQEDQEVVVQLVDFLLEVLVHQDKVTSGSGDGGGGGAGTSGSGGYKTGGSGSYYSQYASLGFGSPC